MKRFYVCGASGNDCWSGALAEPAAAQDDGPFRTLSGAQTAVRQLRATLKEAETIEVVIRGGVYTLSEPWCFNAADSGFGRAVPIRAETWPVVWRGAPGEHVVVSGGRRLGGWTPVRLNGHVVWRAAVPAAGDERVPFRQLWVNGERRPRARLPKTGTYRVAAAPGANYAGTHSETLRRGARRFVCKPGEVSASWKNLQAIDVQFRGWWMSPRAWITQVDDATHTVWLDRDSTIRLAYAPGDGLDYILENVLDALTEPGEWCADPADACVWYMPLPGETPETVDAIAGGIEQVLVLRDVSWVRFENLVFAHSEWRPGALNAVSEQASVSVSGAVAVRGACEGVAFDACRIEHVGGYGFECVEGVMDVTFRNGVIRDLGAGGVKVWHGCRRCRIEDCDIGDGGHLWMSGVGVLIGKATGNSITHCDIHDFYYTGISVGFMWGYAEGDAYGNVIEWNHIHAIGKGVLSDMGGIYLLGNACGTRVRYNRIHDIRSLRYGGWAIYPDEGSSDLLIECNLCSHTDRELFHQHYGRNNLVRNNIFAYGGEAVLAYTQMEGHVGVVFERNIFLARGTPILKRKQGDATHWQAGKVMFDRNLYWCEDGAVRFDGLSAADGDAFEAWCRHCGERGGVVADPDFVDAAGGDFTLPAGAAAHAIGFVPFDLSAAGPRCPRNTCEGEG